MSPVTVFVAMGAAFLTYQMFMGKPANVRVFYVGSRRYRVTHAGPNVWRIETLDASMNVLASATYKYGEDLSETSGNAAVLEQLAKDILFFPGDLFS